MKTILFVAFALYAVCVWVIVDHLRQPATVDDDDLGAVDLHGTVREAVRREEWDARRPNVDLVSRADRMARHPQRLNHVRS